MFKTTHLAVETYLYNDCVTKYGGKVVRFETYLDSEPEKFVPTIDCMIFSVRISNGHIVRNISCTNRYLELKLN